MSEKSEQRVAGSERSVWVILKSGNEHDKRMAIIGPGTVDSVHSTKESAKQRGNELGGWKMDGDMSLDDPMPNALIVESSFEQRTDEN